MADPEHREEEEAPAVGDDEDTGAQVAPIVQLQEVAVTTGEEDEESILDLYVLYFSYFTFVLFYIASYCFSFIAANRSFTVSIKMEISGRREVLVR